MKVAQSILRPSDLPEVVNLGRSTIYRMIANDEFPKPFALGRRAVGWFEADVIAWLKNQSERTGQRPSPVKRQRVSARKGSRSGKGKAQPARHPGLSPRKRREIAAHATA